MTPQEHDWLVKDHLLKDYLSNKEKFGILQTTNSNQNNRLIQQDHQVRLPCTLMSRHIAEKHKRLYLDAQVHLSSTFSWFTNMGCQFS